MQPIKYYLYEGMTLLIPTTVTKPKGERAIQDLATDLQLSKHRMNILDLEETLSDKGYSDWDEVPINMFKIDYVLHEEEITLTAIIIVEEVDSTPVSSVSDGGWIAVEDGLPESAVRCWVCQNHTYVSEGCYDEARWKGWTDYEGLDFVTHWKLFTEPSPPTSKATEYTRDSSRSIGILMAKIEHWQKQYEFSFQFWEDNNTVYINRGSVEIASFGGERTIRKILELTIAWCEKANPRFKYPESLVGKEINLPD